MKRVRATLLPIGLVPLLSCSATTNDPNDIGGPQYAALESMSTTTAEASARARADHALKTAFLIVMENHSWAQIRGNPSAPYINDVLLPASASAENYRNNPKNVHPSEPNYIWMEAGDNLGITNDHDPIENYRNTKKHLTRLLHDASIPWRSYQQGIDGKTCPLRPESSYEPKHNPMVFFSDVTDGNSPSSATCLEHVRPESELAADLSNGVVTGYVLITPDRCHNMHDGCESGDAVQNGDSFLAREIPLIQASAAYQNGGAIFVTWDEGEGTDGSIGLIVSSPVARTGYRSATALSHSSLLRTFQEIFAVRPLLRDAANASSLGELFTTYP